MSETASKADRLKSGRKAANIAITGLLAVPLLVVLLKYAPTIGPAVNSSLSLEAMPEELRRSAVHILFLPLAALAVVFTRLTLGIRVLGPFRSILLAWSFRWTGIWLGTFFLLLTVVALLILRAPVVKMKLPYFARITLMLSGVAVVMVGLLFASVWLKADWLHGIAHLPVVVLCLISEAFAQVLRKEGPLSAVWRMFTTITLGMAITLLAAWGPLGELLLQYPELLLVQIAMIIVIARFLNWRLLAGLNPGQDLAPQDMIAGKFLTEEGETQPATQQSAA